MKTIKAIQKKRGVGISPEFEFFVKTPLTKYEGKYVAILGKRVIASGLDAKEVWKKATKQYPQKLPTIAKIPKQEVLIMSSTKGEYPNRRLSSAIANRMGSY